MSSAACVIGLDFGSTSARGVALEADTGVRLGVCHHAYRHGVLDRALPDGTPLPPHWALQHPQDYLDAAQALLTALGQGREVLAIGVDFTASSPLPTRADGRPLALDHPGEPHAWVKLWKHTAAQPQADRLNRRGHPAFAKVGGRVSAEWLLAKAAELAEGAPGLWAQTARFIEAGDWLVWQLTGQERRSLGLAAYKAQYDTVHGWPHELVPGLGERLGDLHRTPLPAGAPAGTLTTPWRDRCGLRGAPVVAAAVIDSHAVLPAVGAVAPGVLVSALGTSAVHLALDDRARALPAGLEARAWGGSVAGLWCHEAGQAGFGDTLAWWAGLLGGPDDARDAPATAERLRALDAAAADLPPGAQGLMALDWWRGNRVPHADARLGGVILGLRHDSSAAAIHRALAEGLCFGARRIVQACRDGGLPVERLIATSGLALASPWLVQTWADVIGQPVAVPLLEDATAVGAAIHGTVAAGLSESFAAAAQRHGARHWCRHEPRARHHEQHNERYALWRELSDSHALHGVLRSLHAA